MRPSDFLAPLRSTNWADWPCRPTGLLATPSTFGRRYASVPPEAVPIIDLGVDGCHYAVWLDDPLVVNEDPPVVLVSPTDPYPEQIRWVAPSIESFVGLLRRDDDWLLRDDESIARARLLAEHQRGARVTVMTADGIGTVDATNGAAFEPPASAAAAMQTMADLLAADAAADALVVARNAIASHLARVSGFGHAVAAVYRALGRFEFAEVALCSYEPTDDDLEQQARIDELIAKTRSPSN